MKKSVLIMGIIVTLGLAGCVEKIETPSAAVKAEPVAEIVPPAPSKDHLYSIKDGYEYGYERAVSTNESNDGQQASQLVMVKYAGTQQGKYQAFMKEGAIVVAIECSNPCEFIKTMMFDHGNHYKTERMRAVEGTVGWLIMADAINGQLEPYVAVRNGKKVHVWFDEKRGMVATPITTSDKMGG